MKALGRFVNVLPAALFFQRGQWIMLSLNKCEFFLELVHVGETVWGKFARLDGGAHGTSGLVLVLAVAEAASPCQSFDFIECYLDSFVGFP